MSLTSGMPVPWFPCKDSRTTFGCYSSLPILFEKWSFTISTFLQLSILFVTFHRFSGLCLLSHPMNTRITHLLPHAAFCGFWGNLNSGSYVFTYWAISSSHTYLFLNMMDTTRYLCMVITPRLYRKKWTLTLESFRDYWKKLFPMLLVFPIEKTPRVSEGGGWGCMVINGWSHSLCRPPQRC